MPSNLNFSHQTGHSNIGICEEDRTFHDYLFNENCFAVEKDSGKFLFDTVSCFDAYLDDRLKIAKDMLSNALDYVSAGEASRFSQNFLRSLALFFGTLCLKLFERSQILVRSHKEAMNNYEIERHRNQMLFGGLKKIVIENHDQNVVLNALNYVFEDDVTYKEIMDDLEKKRLEEQAGNKQEFNNEAGLRELMDMLIEKRKSLGLSQRVFAETSGMQRTQVRRIESLSHEPTDEILKLYANNLGVNLNVFRDTKYLID